MRSESGELEHIGARCGGRLGGRSIVPFFTSTPEERQRDEERKKIESCIRQDVLEVSDDKGRKGFHSRFESSSDSSSSDTE